MRLAISDADRAVRFYRALGFEPADRRDGEVVLRNGRGQEVVLAQDGERGPVELVLPGPAHVRELYFRLVGAGAPMKEPLTAEGRRARFRALDPDGNEVEVRWIG